MTRQEDIETAIIWNILIGGASFLTNYWFVIIPIMIMYSIKVLKDRQERREIRGILLRVPKEMWDDVRI